MGMAKAYGIWLRFSRAWKRSLASSVGRTSAFRMAIGLVIETPRFGFGSGTPHRICARGWNPSGPETRQSSLGPADKLNIPIELPVGKERDEVLDVVVARLLEIARMITPEPCEPTE